MLQFHFYRLFPFKLNQASLIHDVANVLQNLTHGGVFGVFFFSFLSLHALFEIVY